MCLKRGQMLTLLLYFALRWRFLCCAQVYCVRQSHSQFWNLPIPRAHSVLTWQLSLLVTIAEVFLVGKGLLHFGDACSPQNSTHKSRFQAEWHRNQQALNDVEIWIQTPFQDVDLFLFLFSGSSESLAKTEGRPTEGVEDLTAWSWQFWKNYHFEECCFRRHNTHNADSGQELSVHATVVPRHWTQVRTVE